MTHEARDLAIEIARKPLKEVRGLCTYVQLLDDCHWVPNTLTQDKCQISLVVNYSKLTFAELYFHNNWIQEIEKEGECEVLGKYEYLCQKPGYAKVCWPDKEQNITADGYYPPERYIYVCRTHISTVAQLVFGNEDVPIVRNYQ